MLKIQITFLIWSLIGATVICRKTNIQKRMFRGEPSIQIKHPFFVLIELKPHVDNKLNCGGALVHDRFVVTAAHCIDWVTENIRLKFGVHEPMKKDEETRTVIEASANDIVLHPRWSRENKVNDIAIIKMNEPIQHNPFIQPIQFSNDCELEEVTDASFFGWGITNSQLEFASHIQWASKKCGIKYPYYNIHSRSAVFCADGRSGQSVCKSDSGSPLIRTNDGVIIGIVSRGPKVCGKNRKPQAYTKVFNYQKWIANVTGFDIPYCTELNENEAPIVIHSDSDNGNEI